MDLHLILPLTASLVGFVISLVPFLMKVYASLERGTTQRISINVKGIDLEVRDINPADLKALVDLLKEDEFKKQQVTPPLTNDEGR